MRDKSLKTKGYASAASQERIDHLRELFNGNECKVQFALWSDNVHLDVSGIWSENGEPVFRPAICAWESWKAAWAFQLAEVRAALMEDGDE